MRGSLRSLIRIRSFALLLLLSLPAFAATSPSYKVHHYKIYRHNVHQENWRSAARLSMGAYGGYGVINGAYEQDGDTAQGRLTLALHALNYKKLDFGVEAGLQSGNTMRLDASSSVITAAGGLPIQSTLKPFVDLLLTLKAPIGFHDRIFGLLKGGIAYRQLNLNDRTSSRDQLNRVNPEIQVGLSLGLTKHLSFSAFYQGIYSDDYAGLAINSAGDVTAAHIPTQQAVFFGFEYSL